MQLEQNVVKINVLAQLAARCLKNIAVQEQWDLRTLQKEYKTEKKGSGVNFATSPEYQELREKLQALPAKDRAYHFLRLQIEDASKDAGYYQEKADRIEAALLEEQVSEDPEFALLE